MKIKDYTIVHAENLHDLVKEVFALLQAGWQPIGGVAASEEYWAQAMVKYAEE